MIASVQRAIVLTLLFGAGFSVWAFARAGHLGSGLVFAGLILASYSILLALEVVLLALFGSFGANLETPKPTVVELLLAWIRESACAPQVFFWRQPFRSGQVEDELGDRTTGRRGVVLVHGYFCNRGMWNPWLVKLQRLNVPFVAPNLEPAFGSINEYFRSIGDAVRQLRESTGHPVVVVGHSMGGLAARAWLAGAGCQGHVHYFISVAAPHRGSWMARFGHAANVRQMRVGSPWLRELETREGGKAVVPTTCYYGQCDNIVFPITSATLPWADNKLVRRRAHLDLLDDPEVFEDVLRCTAVELKSEASRVAGGLAADRSP